MKTKPTSRTRCIASVLIIGLVITAVLILSLLSYLSLIHHQNMSVARSQAWNAALALAEAGVEEALAQLNPSAARTNLLSGNAWSLNGTFYEPNSGPRSLIGGSYLVKYTDIPPPTIYSTGYATVPALSAVIKRVVEVKTTGAPMFDTAMAARQDIDFKGNNVLVDSYDSSDPQHSTASGLYDPATHKAGGDIASTAGLVNVQGADIKGKLLTGPSGSYQIGNGEVGDLNWTGPGIQPGWYRNDYNMEFSDVPEPFTSATSPLPKTIGTTNFMYYLGSGNYMINGDVVMGSNGDGDKMYVAANATLYITGNFSMSGNKSSIFIKYGATLKLYIGGASATFTRVNTEGNAYTFQYYGLPNNTSVTWNGNDTYVGIVYAPQATFNLGGGGNNSMDFQGSCVANSIKLNGHFSVHYDENLRRVGPPRGYIAISWKEI